jgi:hypothetical protein
VDFGCDFDVERRDGCVCWVVVDVLDDVDEASYVTGAVVAVAERVVATLVEGTAATVAVRAARVVVAGRYDASIRVAPGLDRGVERRATKVGRGLGAGARRKTRRGCEGKRKTIWLPLSADDATCDVADLAIVLRGWARWAVSVAASFSVTPPRRTPAATAKIATRCSGRDRARPRRPRGSRATRPSRS